MKRLLVILVILTLTLPAAADDLRRTTPDEKLIALTFDDGPHTEYTLEILDILEEYGAVATFFIIGENAKSHPDLIKKIDEAGCEVGNHTWSHKYLDTLSEKEVREEIEEAHRIIYELLGKEPRVFRAPGGRGSDTVLKVADEFGYTSVLWSRDTRDWACPTVDSVISSALDGVEKGDIILFHDYNAKKSPTPEALRRILPTLLEKGYRTVTVTELIEIARGTPSASCPSGEKKMLTKNNFCI